MKIHFTVRRPLGVPIARAFDLPGAEAIFRAILPPQLRVVDVHSPDDRDQVVVEAIVENPDPISTKLLVGAIVARWTGKSLLVIGIGLALGAIIIAIRIDTELIPEMHFWTIVGVVVVVLILVSGRRR